VLVARLLERKRTDRLPSAEATHRALVDAKSKVAAGMGAAQHAWAGKQGALSIDADRKELSQLRKKQVTHERDESPFYERAWFLALSLAVVVGIGVWSLWPRSEDALFAGAQPLIESDDPVQWRRAEEQYLKELLERFPDTKYAEQIDAFHDRLAMHRALERVKNIERFGREPTSEPERLYAAALRHEQFGSLNTAWSLYEQIVEQTSTKDNDDRAFVHLARDAIRRVKSKASAQQTPFDFITGKLEQAQKLSQQGQHAQARHVLDEVIVLYANDRELKPLVDKARNQLRQLAALGTGSYDRD
jgi:eukaryotic-like serine/threonine-protein kinase